MSGAGLMGQRVKVRIQRSGLALLLTLLIVVVGWYVWKQQRGNSFPEVKNLNIVVIVIDSLRADRLSFYGYSKETAPFLSSLARRSVLFERALSASSTTAPATASIFTGVHPSEHGIITGFIANQKLSKERQGITLNRIPAELKTLGEVFKAAGYRTYSLADNLNISVEMGYSAGFDKFETMRYKTAAAMNEILRNWQPEIDSGGKYFMYLHYMDPHTPYHRRSPWFEKTGDKQQRIASAYDSEIRYLDEHLRQMFELYHWQENALVVVLADHGEEFLDHGGMGHGKTLYREVLHVPLFFSHPDLSTGRRVADYVTSMDLLPTLAGLLDLPVETSWRGRSLEPLLDGSSLPDRDLFAELLRRPEHSRGAARSVVSGQWQLIDNQPKSGEPYGELFDLQSDFSQRHDLIQAESSRAAQLKKSLGKFIEGRLQLQQEQIQVDVDQETLRQLRTLGYLE